MENPKDNNPPDTVVSVDGVDSQEQTGSFSQFDEAFQSDFFEWPEPQWFLPDRQEGWKNRLPAPDEFVENVKPALAQPGIVALGAHHKDQEIALDWLFEVISTGSEPGFDLICRLHFDTEDTFSEAALCSEIRRLHSEKVQESGEKSSGMRMLAVVACKMFSANPSERARQLDEFKRRRITLVFAMDSAKLGKFSHNLITAYDVDTLDFAFRDLVFSTVRDERAEILDAQLNELQQAQRDQAEMLNSIRKEAKRRNDLRDELSRLIEQGGEKNSALLYRRAVQKVADHGPEGQINKRLIEILGLDGDALNAPLPSLDDLNDQPTIKEPYATAVFLFWACHNVRPEGVLQVQFQNLFRSHLARMRDEETLKTNRALERAKINGVKRKKALARIKTPITDFLEFHEDQIDKVIPRIGAQTIRRDEGEYVTYSRQTQDLIKAHLRQVKSYVEQQINLLESWLNPIYEKDHGVFELGCSLFIHEAERHGKISEKACRNYVVEQLSWLISVAYNRNLVQADGNEASQIVLKDVPEGIDPEAIIQAVVHHSMAPRRKITRERLRSLIANWYSDSSEESGVEIEDTVDHFSKLVTQLLQKLLHSGEHHGFVDLFREFIHRSPALLNIKSVLRLVANTCSVPDTNFILEIIERDAEHIGKIGAQYSAYQYIVEEFTNTRQLNERPLDEQWSIMSLALRVVPACVQRLQQTDYEPTDDPAFSSDYMLSNILREENGIEQLVDTLLHPRFRNYAADVDNIHSLLSKHQTKIADDDLHKIIRNDLEMIAYHCETIWFRTIRDVREDPAKLERSSSNAKQPSSESGATPEDNVDAKTSVTTDDGNADSEAEKGRRRATKTRREIKALWRKENPNAFDPERWEAHKEIGETLPYVIMQELHGMFLCSERQSMADRLLSHMKSSMPSRDRDKILRVVRTKTTALQEHRRELTLIRQHLERHNESTAELDMWLSFVETRASVVPEFLK